MNEIETDIYLKSEKDEDDEEYNKRYRPVFEAYCTDKKRVYGGNSHSFGYLPQYSGIEASYEIKVEFKNERKAEVIFKTETKEFGDTGYLFVVVKKKTGWKIDSYKEWSNRKEKWVNGIL